MKKVATSRFSRLLALGIGLMTSACAWIPAELELQPKIEVPPSTVGRGTSLLFRFSDERDDITIGHRGVATVGAKVSAGQLPAVVETQLRDILTAKGYRFATDATAANAEVTYRLRAFKFNIETGFWTGGRNASVVLAVDARRRNLTHTNVYRTNSEQRILFVPGETEINQQMNAGLNEVLTQTARDEALDQFLTAR